MSQSSPAGPGPSSSASVHRSIFGIDPIDEILTHIGGWAYTVTQGGTILSSPEYQNPIDGSPPEAEIEIEAKIGRLIDTRTNRRLELPILNETILSDSSGIRFESNMSSEEHRHYNTILNSLCPPDPTNQRPTIKYKRHQEVDYFYATGSSRGEKVRVTKDFNTRRIKERGSVVKKRLANLEVYCPNRAFDYRISINLEIQAPEPSSSSTHDYERDKNRLSYTYPGIRIDLTQVKVDRPQPSQQHELEVELVPPTEGGTLSEDGIAWPFSLVSNTSASLFSPPVLQAQGRGLNMPNGAAGGGQDWTEYEEVMGKFLNDVRLLIRNAS